jgi:uncharacterized BrkB/YihY/UPF0761 family membrane protein
MKKRDDKKAAQEKNKSNQDIIKEIRTSGFTLGILSIILMGGLGILISIVGFIFCYYSQRKNSSPIGKVGIILNIIGFVVSILFLILYTFYYVGIITPIPY